MKVFPSVYDFVFLVIKYFNNRKISICAMSAQCGGAYLNPSFGELGQEDGVSEASWDTK